MRTRGNMHTHCNWCHGEGSAKDMAEVALKKGMTFLGVSPHAYCRYGPDFGIRENTLKPYLAEIAALKTAYAGKIDLYGGMEMDMIDPMDAAGCDYIIGSNHFALGSGVYCEVDNTPEILTEGIVALFSGDPMKMARGYYEVVAQNAEAGGFDFLAHFDLLTKFNEGNRIFDETSPAYRHIALAALDVVAERGIPMEINTGAISRGFRSTPYPAMFLLKRMAEKKVPVLLSSDAHRPEWIDAGFELGEALLIKAGYRAVWEWTPGGWQERGL